MAVWEGLMCDGAFHRGDRSVALATSSSEHDGQIDVVRPMTLSDTKGARYDEPELARVQVRLAAGAAAQQQSVIAVHFQSHGTASASSSSSSFHTASLLTPSHTDSPPSRISVHSSGSANVRVSSGSSSLASSSVDALDDSFYSSSSESPVNVTQMVAKGVPEAEILAIWLDKIGMTEYLAMFLTQGYDLSSIARITPEDLLSLGITNPAHRKRLMNEIHSWQITDSWPSVPPQGGLRSWLTLLAMPEYISVFDSQGYDSVQEVMKLSWEDFEDIGVKRLGHLKRLGLAIKKLKVRPLTDISPLRLDWKKQIEYKFCTLRYRSIRTAIRWDMRDSIDNG
ncbi:unnamed protein product [Heligmosomoides polygyrus]|uniref:SAM domain-containing protein n=1 Tax=Heligmosomoides polygyrus TaxID=6339 RepID=A0A183FH20_HELPZ|nr:unnamed protein product [Heligmosomoides polygyrus]